MNKVYIKFFVLSLLCHMNFMLPTESFKALRTGARVISRVMKNSSKKLINSRLINPIYNNPIKFSFGACFVACCGLDYYKSRVIDTMVNKFSYDLNNKHHEHARMICKKHNVYPFIINGEGFACTKSFLSGKEVIYIPKDSYKFEREFAVRHEISHLVNNDAHKKVLFYGMFFPTAAIACKSINMIKKCPKTISLPVFILLYHLLEMKLCRDIEYRCDKEAAANDKKLLKSGLQCFNRHSYSESRTFLESFLERHPSYQDRAQKLREIMSHVEEEKIKNSMH